MRSVKWNGTLGDALQTCSQGCYLKYGAKPDGTPATPGTKVDALALAACFVQCDLQNGNPPEVPPGGMTLPGGTVLPGGLTLPQGWTLPQGLQLPGGITLPFPIPLPGGGVSPQTPLGGLTLPYSWTLPLPWQLPFPITVPASGWTLPGGTPLPTNLPPPPAPQPTPAQPAPIEDKACPSGMHLVQQGSQYVCVADTAAPPVPVPSSSSSSSDSGKGALWIAGGVGLLVLAYAAAKYGSEVGGGLAGNPRRTARRIGAIGDVNPVDYGGGVIYKVTGNPEPVLEYVHGLDGGDTSKMMTLYRVEVPDDVFGYHNWVNIESVASAIGADPEELRRAGKSKKLMDRVWAIEAIASTHGWHELDHYPFDMTEAELRRRWHSY